MIEVIQPPQTEPLTLAEVAQHLRLDDDIAAAAEAHLTGLIVAARTHAERYLGRSLGEQTLVLAMQWFPAEIPLSRPPIRAIESVIYDDGDGIEETLDPDEYRLAGEMLISTYSDRSWPRSEMRPDSVRITYQAGYDEVPAPIKQAMLVMIERLFDRHADPYDDTLARLSDALLWPYRQLSV